MPWETPERNVRLADWIDSLRMLQPFNSDAFEEAKDRWDGFEDETADDNNPDAAPLVSHYRMSEELLVMSKGYRDSYMDRHLLDTLQVLSKSFEHLNVKMDFDTKFVLDNERNRKHVLRKLIQNPPCCARTVFIEV